MKNFTFLLLLVATSILAQEDAYSIVNLKMNTGNSHYGLSLSQNNKVYFSSPVLDKVNLQRKKQKADMIFSLFEAKKMPNGEIEDIKKLKIKRKQHLNTSNAIVSPDGKYIYLTANNRSKSINRYKMHGKGYNLYIERGEYIEGKGWTNFKRLEFCYMENYSYAHPALSPDGKTLYFVSNMPGTKGPTDIFKVSVLGNNKYSEPVNLGDLVNSSRKEMFPFVSKDGTLYFSSDRAYGVGGLDVYSAKKNKTKGFDSAKLLQGPVNSKYDDFCYVIDNDKKEGYFSSKRPNGKGDDDIYYFSVTKPNPTFASNNGSSVTYVQKTL